MKIQFLIGEAPHEHIRGYVENVSFVETDIKDYKFPCYIALNCYANSCADKNHNKFYGSKDNRLCEFAERCRIQNELVDLYFNNEHGKNKTVIRIEFGKSEAHSLE